MHPSEGPPPTPQHPGFGRGRVMLAGLVALALVAAAALMLKDRLGDRRQAQDSPARPSSSDLNPTRDCPSGDGQLRMNAHFTAEDQTRVQYSISLPSDYYTACKEYPVLYALHGKEQNDATFLTAAESLRQPMTAGVLDEAIIVTPDSFVTGRWENRDTGPAEDNFISRLIPYVENHYRVKQGPSHRLLTGFSMGGHGALRFGLKYPDKFAAVWSVDGAMAGLDAYLPYVKGHTSADFHIMSVGGRLNGQRVDTVIKGLAQHGITIPNTYQDRDHEFVEFVDQDAKSGWPAMKFLQSNLGRAVKAP